MKWRVHLLTLVMIVPLLACASCDRGIGGSRNTEIQRDPSPDGRSVAQVTRVDSSGATDSDRYQIRLQYLKSKHSRPVLILEANRTTGLKVKWTDKNTLEVCYPKADITTFRNMYDYGEEGWNYSEWYWVEILLRRVPDIAQCTA